jgi:hypothetical protein
MGTISNQHVERLQLVAPRLRRRRPISLLWYSLAVFLIFVAAFGLSSVPT